MFLLILFFCVMALLCTVIQEKAAYFQDRWRRMFIGVRSFHGEDDGASRSSLDNTNDLVSFLFLVKFIDHSLSVTMLPMIIDRSSSDGRCGCRSVHLREGECAGQPTAGRGAGATPEYGSSGRTAPCERHAEGVSAGSTAHQGETAHWPPSCSLWAHDALIIALLVCIT
jgi:hypothetical protein